MTKEQFIELTKTPLIPDNRPDWLLQTIRRPEQSLYYPFFLLLAREVKPKLVVELGTNRGTGAAHFRLGCKESKIYTIDIKQPEHIRERLEKLDVLVYRLSTNSAVNMFLDNSIDILFIDADHRYEGVKKDFENYRPKMKPGGIIIFDDIHLDEGMQRFWDEIEEEKIDISHLHPSPGFGAMICE